MNYICPITSSIPSNSIWVLLCILVAILIVYILQYQWLKSERECFVSRNWTLFFLFGAYLMFRLDNRLQFKGVGESVLSYTDYGWILVGVIEKDMRFNSLIRYLLLKKNLIPYQILKHFQY